MNFYINTLSKQEAVKMNKYNELYQLYKNKPLKSLIDEFAKEFNLKIVMHFPHSSLDVPKSFFKDVDIDLTYFQKINLKMSDLLLLDLFKDWNYEKVIAPFSRLYVDVEKYWDDEKEIMAKHGMGAIYTKDINGNILHKKTKEFILEAKQYYEDYHDKLSKACNDEKDVLILDMHSFNFAMSRFVTNSILLPDICIGVNNDESQNKKLLNKIKHWCKTNNISYCINNPYSGSIMPNKRNGKNKIYSIMFELNKEWYL